MCMRPASFNRARRLRRFGCAIIVLCVVLIGIGSCNSRGAPQSSQASNASSEAAPGSNATADACREGRQVLADLRKLSSGTSTMLDQSAMAMLHATLADLGALARSTTNQQIASLAESIHSTLSGLASLAETDPHGSQATTRQRAETLEERYLTSSQRLPAEISRICPGA